MDATFFFDPACPWTWRTSRWLVAVAGARGLRVEWRAFSLAILNEGRIAPEGADAMAATGRRSGRWRRSAPRAATTTPAASTPSWAPAPTTPATRLATRS
ncbi:DsbA family protein [Micromonospora sp. IBHARD004]|uniref:DsbA family protein n=1 Tax=Micromonospora sp. IBHARD004 TaxID=3457764 RepID=UPI0040586EC0